MASLATRLQRREDIAHGTMAFHFDKPAGFRFKAGQAIDLILPDLAGGASGSDRHAFSIVSAPHESDLVVATRMRDSTFKNALAGLPIGGLAQVDGPFGSLTLHRKPNRAAVFIAGGIGITPFISMLRHASRNAPDQRLVLLYSNRRPEDTAFLTELQRLEGDNRNFRLVATMTRMVESSLLWMGRAGPIDEDLLKRVAEDLPDPIYYVAGPPSMVTALCDALERAGVDADDIRSEAFHGY
ncbi:FAD-dependent oxidoreductase [Ramlibacter sp.]|uniref:ferredoxin--NADP reductase n=1 Tax=Ramlibacter sp. TaxID=1917967 RepID=UPI002D658F46|nr:FAD-dependent oxidoreductase [Ramlibacter sp.]HYD76485.1 FAD-dependent oxidoreductase [Ramlibacter sp.]